MAKAQRRISEREEQLRGQLIETRPPAATTPYDEARHLETALAKAQKAGEITETEVGRLCNDVRQSSDRETSVRAQAQKALKEAQEKL